MAKLFGFNILEECDPISIECILKDNDWKPVWSAYFDYWQKLDELLPANVVLVSWLQTVPECPPVVSKVGQDGSINTAYTLKIWIRPEDYVLYVLKFA